MDNPQSCGHRCRLLRSFHAQKYQRIKDVELVAVVDENTERLSEVSQRLNVPGFLDLHWEVAKKVDLVSIVVPPANHYDIGVFFLENNIHCLIEKPLAERVEDAQHLIEIAKKKVAYSAGWPFGKIQPYGGSSQKQYQTARQIHTLRHLFSNKEVLEVDVVL